ncbi:MAG: TolC family protein, partial [Syntrophales bacterium]|nr:TolC family protein [Syntrophales bacterium]
MKRAAAVIFLSLIMLGCTIGRDYRRPAVDTPKTWRFEEKDAKLAANTAWWTQFNDPVLNNLIDTALKENKDLLIATARIDEFMGRYGFTRSALFPQIGAGGQAERQRITEAGSLPMTPDSPSTYNSYQVTLNASWEIDIWGKLRRATEASRADLLSTEAARQAVILTLVTAVANNYVGLLNLDQQLEIVKRTVKTRRD